MKDQYEFLDYRKEQESNHLALVDKDNPMSSLLSVELNCTELCNRRCEFCPRYDSDVYPNQNLNMDLKTATTVGDQLAAIQYKGKISFSGYGENILNKAFPNIVNQIRIRLPHNIIECNTNGDKLTKKMAEDLYNGGLSNLYINLYDGIHQKEHFDKIVGHLPSDWYVYRKHWDPEDFGMILNNRSGVMKWVEQDPHPGRPCYYPSYKMMIDWNGNVLFCSNDWARERIVGNIHHHTIEQIWMSDTMMEYRKKLGSGDRSMSPCNKCSVPGDLFGRASYEMIACV